MRRLFGVLVVWLLLAAAVLVTGQQQQQQPATVVSGQPQQTQQPQQQQQPVQQQPTQPQTPPQQQQPVQQPPAQPQQPPQQQPIVQQQQPGGTVSFFRLNSLARIHCGCLVLTCIWFCVLRGLWLARVQDYRSQVSLSPAPLVGALWIVLLLLALTSPFFSSSRTCLHDVQTVDQVLGMLPNTSMLAAELRNREMSTVAGLLRGRSDCQSRDEGHESLQRI
jgi:hypothetical protein